MTSSSRARGSDISEEPKKRIYVQRAKDETYILKSQAIALPDKRVMYIFYCTKQGKAKVLEGFRKTFMRIGTIGYWNSLLKDLEENNPGDLIRTSMIGCDEDYLVFLNHLHCTRTFFARILRKKMRFAMHLKDFLEKVEAERNMDIKDMYATEYEGLNISDYDRFSEGRWYCHTIRTFERGRPRKKMRVIQ